jgi:hypothetical protein
MSYGRLSLRGDRWILSDVPPHVAIRLKSMFPRIPKTQTGVFDLPCTDEMCAELDWFMARYPMQMASPDRRRLRHGVQAFEADRRRVDEIFLPDWTPPPRFGFKPPHAPYPMQSQAVEMLLRKRRLLLGDDVGFGKTIVALAALAGSPFLPAAIVVEAHLPSQWVQEFIEPFTYLIPHIIDGTKPYQLPPANLYIFRYSNIAGWVDVAATGMFKSVVFDEIQQLRGGFATAKGKAAKVFAENAALRLGLSATPVFNYGSEAFNIIEFLEPGLLGTWEEFTREWCRYRGNDKWEVKDPDALGTYLREAQIFLRRVRQGRPINRIPIEVDHDEEVVEASADLARKLAMKVLTGSFEERGQASRELDAYARRVTGLAKARSVAAYVRMLLKAGTPVLLGGWHRDVYDIWLAELKEFNPVLYTGSESPKQKDTAKRAFIDGETDLMIISLRSGAGLDGLQKRCSTVVIGELDWSPQVIEQLLGRVDRPGQTAEQITAIFLYTNEGSDPPIMTVNAIKRDQARGVTDPGLGVQSVFTDVERIKLLARQFLDREQIA